MPSWKLIAGVACALLLSGCTSEGSKRGDTTPLADAGQLVLVTTPAWDAPRGQLRTFERQAAGWKEVGAARVVTIGRAGAGWGRGLHASQSGGPVKREGDGRAPAGVFAIGDAFGYPETLKTSLRYAPMRASHWCIDVPGSPLYNRIVDADAVGAAAISGSTEPMRRDLHVNGDQRYRLGFVVEHNAEAHDMAGSCIFAHVWKSPQDATAGCTAMSDTDMQALLAWLDRRRTPRFVLLPQAEFERLRVAWQLP